MTVSRFVFIWLLLVILVIFGESLTKFSEKIFADEVKSAAVNREGLHIVKRVAWPGNITEYEYSNGMVLLVRRKTGEPQGTVRVLVKNTGSINEGEYLGTGISHLLEHLVAGGGTKQRSKTAINDRINTMGGATNAGTSKETTIYYIDCATEHLSEAMAILADQMQHTVFIPKEFGPELEVVRQEALDAESNRGTKGFELLTRTVYREHPYRHPIIGYPDLLKKLTAEDVEKFYRSRYLPNNQIFMVAGNVDPDKMAAELLEHYRNTPRGKELRMVLGDEPPQISRREAAMEMDGGSMELWLAWSGTRLSDRDTYALDVLSNLLTMGDSSRLQDRLRQQKQLALSISSFNMTPEVIRGIFVFHLTALPDHMEAAERELLDELKRFKDIPVGAAELERAKKQLESAFIFQKQEIQNEADSILRNYAMTGDPNFDRQYITGIRNVSVEDIRSVARKYFLPETLTRVLIAPQGLIPKTVDSGEKLIEEDIQALRFPDSKIRLLTRRTNKEPLVNIQVFALGGALVDSDETAGRTALLAEMLNKGSARFKQKEIAEFFDSIGAEFDIRSGRNTIYANATVLKADYAKALDIMLDSLLNPTLSEEEFQKAQKTLLGRIERRKDDPMSELIDYFSLSLPLASPYHHLIQGTPQTIEKIRLDDLNQFHRKTFVPSNMIVTVFGDMDPNAAAQQVSGILAGVKQSGPDPVISFDRTNELIQPIEEHFKTKKTTSHAIIAWPGVSVRDEKDYAILTVLQTLLGGYGYPGGRIFEQLRSEGLIYRLFIDQMTGPTPGYLFAAFETRPGQIPAVLDRINKAVTAIGQGELSQDELKKAKERIIAFHAMSKQTLEQQARQAALDDLYGLGFTHDLNFNDRINAVTLDEVVAAARKYTRQHILITLDPEK